MMAVYKTGVDDLARLTAIQDSLDSFTQEVLFSLELTSDARCMEVGAGGGSIARWLAEQCAAGVVEAVDLDVSLLDCDRENLRVIEANIEDLERAEGSIDLIHERFVLSHLPSRDILIGRFAQWLRPGGWLVVTEPYQLDPAGAPHPCIEKVLRAYVSYVTGKGMDLEWSRSVPSLVARRGLTSVSTHSRTTSLGGGGSDRWEPLIAPVADELLLHGVDPGDLAEFYRLLRDPTMRDSPQIILTTVAQKPGA